MFWLLGLLYGIMAFFIIPNAKKQIKQYAHETELIDGLFFSSPDQIYEMITSYGEKGRKLYIAVEATADLVYSIVIAAFFSFFLVWSTSGSNNKKIKIKHLLLLTFLIIITNCLENGCIIWMLFHFPERFFYLAIITSFLTFIKGLAIISCLSIATWNLFRMSLIKFGSLQKPKLKKSLSEEID